MKDKGYVTVIIPTFNCAKYIIQAIESVINQSYTNFEIIVIDDGSTDNTRVLLAPFINRSEIKYLYQDNSGPAGARNAGIAIAEGEYIAFLDSDDIWHPLFLQSLLEKFSELVGLVYCSCEFIDADRRVINGYPRSLRNHRGNVLKELFCDFFVITSSVIMRKECFTRIGYFREDLLVGEDYELYLRVAKVYDFDCVDVKLLERRVLSTSLSRLDFKLDAFTDLNTLETFVRNHPDFYALHRKDVNLRLSTYYFDFAYRCLETKNNYLALKLTLKSLKYRLSWFAFKNLIGCLTPSKIRGVFKAKL